MTEKFESILSSPQSTNECPGCGHVQTRMIGGGSGFTGTRTEYPYKSTTLPLKPGMKPGDAIVQSAAHEREIMAGAWNGEKFEKNAV